MAVWSRLFHAASAFSLLVAIALSSVLVAPPLPAVAQQGEETIEPRGPRGGPPRGLTPELVVADTRYVFDRVVPVRRQDLVRIAEADPIIVYARTDEPPFAEVYASVPPREQAAIARYLPENAASPETPCRAEEAELGSIAAGEAGIFAFAGLEPDLSPDGLDQSGSTPDGFPAYIGTEQPLEEILVDAPEGLQRFVHLDDQGLPAVLADGFPFAGRAFAFSAPSDEDIGALTRIGCVGAFPLFADPGQEDTPDEVVAVVGGQPLRFAATGEDAASTVAEPVAPGGDPAEQAAGDEADPAASPTVEEATTEPEATAAVDGEEPGAATPATEATASAAAGELPEELVVGERRYLLDRPVPVPVELLSEIDQQGDLTVYAIGDEPFDRVFASDAAGGVVRYLSQRRGNPDAPCPAETAELGLIDGGESGQFVFAGPEPDLTPDDLQQIATTPDNQAVYAESAEAFAELFVASDDGLLRYVVLDERGLPEQVGDDLTFGGQEFAFVEEATGVDRAALGRVGCAGPFSVLAESAADAGQLSDIYLAVADRVFLFRATTEEPDTVDGPVGTPPASPEATAAPTEAPAPTEAAPPIAPVEETPTATPVPTATPAPTEEPTATPAPEPTSTPAPTATPEPTATPLPPTPSPEPTTAPEPTAAATTAAPPTETPAPEPTTPPVATTADAAATEAPAPPAASPTAEPAAAQEAATQPPPAVDALPPQLDVRNTTYDLVPAEGRVDIDIRNLVEVDVVQVQNQNVTIYAEQDDPGVVAPLYAIVGRGRLLGRYVPAAAAAPAPPPSLPPTVQVQGATYVFNEVETNINIQNLVEVEVIQVQNTNVTVYAEQDVRGRPIRLFGVADDGRVVGQYIETTVVEQARRTRRPRPFRSAVAATPPPNAQSSAASTAVPRPNACSGDPAPLGPNGLPRNLPTRVQLQGISYSLVGGEAGAAGTLTRIGCVGPFEIASSDLEDAGEVVFLRVPGAAEGQGAVYRFQAIATVDVELQVTGRPQTITLRPAADQPAANYSIRATWPRSTYSSTTVILYSEDPANQTPPLIYAYDVDDDVVGEYAPEGEIRDASPDLQAAAEANGLNPDLTLAGLQRYVLVAIWEPSGSTANGWVTFYSADPGDRPETLLGRDPRQPELLVYRRSG